MYKANNLGDSGKMMHNNYVNSVTIEESPSKCIIQGGTVDQKAGTSRQYELSNNKTKRMKI